MDINKVGWITIRDKKVLMVRSINKDIFYIPGGKVDPGETKQQALIREIKEELDANLISDSITAFGSFEALAHGKSGNISVKVSCYFSEFEGDLKPKSEIEELAWFDSKSTDKISEVSVKILHALADADLID